MWEHLYGDGDIDECSLLVVPFLVEAAALDDSFSLQALLLAGSIELVRATSFMKLPKHATSTYGDATRRLRESVLSSLGSDKKMDAQELLMLLAFAAAHRGEPALGKALHEMNADDLVEP